ncbi:hypothetical protein [Mucilaginibacter sp.]
MSKAQRTFIALCLIVSGAALLYVAAETAIPQDWLRNVMGISGIILGLCAAVYIKGLYPGNRWPKNFNNKDWE